MVDGATACLKYRPDLIARETVRQMTLDLRDVAERSVDDPDEDLTW
jgi:hypothetical protein